MIAKRQLLQFSAIVGTPLGLIYLLIIIAIWGLPQINWHIPATQPLMWRHVWLWGLPMLFVLLVALFWLSELAIAARRNRRFAREAVIYHIAPRADLASGGCETGRQFWNQVSDMLPAGEHIIMSLCRQQNQTLQFMLTARPKTAEPILHQMLADWPGTQIRRQPPEDEAQPEHSSPNQRTVRIVLKTHATTKPLVTQVQDPLHAPLVELSRLPSGVQAGIQIQVRRDMWTQKRQLRAAQRQASNKPPTQTERRADRASDDRAAHPFLETQIMVWATASDAKQATQIVRSLAQDVAAQYGVSNPLVSGRERQQAPQKHYPAFAGQPLTDKEVGSLMHLLGKEGVQLAPLLATATARNLEPSQACRLPILAILAR